MALRCPHADWRPLGAQAEPAMTGHDLVIVHTIVGFLYSTDTMFRSGGYDGTESHYGIGGTWGTDASRDLDGAVWQWQDRARQADANLQANPTAISIETADNAPAKASDIARWTPAQAEALVTLLAWECSPAAHAGCPSTWSCHQAGIPAALVLDSKPGRRGIAYHRQGIDPWRVDGGQAWSTARGKECPGPHRISQLTAEIIPAVRARLEGEVMDAVDVWKGKGVDVIPRNKVNEPKVPVNPDNPMWTPASIAEEDNRNLRDVLARVRDLETAARDQAVSLTDLSVRLAAVAGNVEQLAGVLAALDATAITTAVETAVDRVRAELAELRLGLVVTD